MSAPQFLVSPDALDAADAVLTGSELRHLRVRRLRPGSELILCDGQGRQRRGIITALDRHRAVINLGRDSTQQPDPSFNVVLAQAMLKGDKMDFVVEKATELGVTRLLLFTSERSVGYP